MSFVEYHSDPCHYKGSAEIDQCLNKADPGCDYCEAQ